MLVNVKAVENIQHTILITNKFAVFYPGLTPIDFTHVFQCHFNDTWAAFE